MFFFPRSLFIFLIVNLSLTPSQGISQSLIEQPFYLVDTLSLEEMTAREQQLLDSCLNAYHATKSDLKKIDALERICSNTQLGQFAYNDILLSIIEEAIANSPSEISLKKSLVSALNNATIIYEMKGDITKAVEYANKSLICSKEIDDKLGRANCLNTMAGIYSNQGNIPKALKYYTESLTITRALNNKTGIISCLNNIAYMYSSCSDYSQALRYYQLALKITKELNDEFVMTIIAGNVGGMYLRLADTVNAIMYINKSLGLAKKINDRLGMATALDNLGSIYYYQKDFDSSLKLCYKSLAISKEMDDKKGISHSLNDIALIYLGQEKLDTAEIFAQQSLDIAKEIKHLQLITYASKTLFNIYNRKNYHEKALNMYLHYDQMKDSLNSKENLETLNRLKNKTTLERKDQQILLLNKEKKLRTTQFKLSLAIAGFIMVLLMVFSRLWVLKKEKRHENELISLRTLTQELEQKEVQEKVITSIMIKFGKTIKSVKLEDVIYFKAQNKHIFLVDQHGKSYVVDHTLSLLEKTLPSYFVRIHRGSIINTHKILEMNKVNRGAVVFTMDDEVKSKVSSSTRYADKVKNIIQNFDLKEA